MDALLEQRIQYLERTLSTKSRSPILVQLASLYLEAGRPHDALRYCDNAIAQFPHYTTAHLIRAKVLSALEMKAEARREYEIVHSILPDVEILKARLEEIPASETETFAEPVSSENVSATAVEETLDEAMTQAPVAEKDQPAQAEIESREESMVEEEFVASPEENNELQEDAPVEQDTETVASAQDVVLDRTTDDPFGIGSSEEAPVASEETMTAVPADEDSTDEENTFGDLGPVEAEAGPAHGKPTPEEGISYEDFAEAMRRELSGTEGTASIEDFLKVGSQEKGGQEQADDEIGELTEKLQNAPKITPIIDITEKKAPPPSEEDTPAGTGFVTPTLAEIYAKQGWYEDAIVAYKTLARIKPAEKERFEKRIQELEELKRSEEGGA